MLATRFLAELRSGRPIDSAALAVAAQDLARRQFAFSAARSYRDPGQTKRTAGDDYCVLFEHEYGRMVAPEALAALHATLAQCFELLASQTELLAMLRVGHEHQAELSLTFRLDAFHLPTATATLDLVFRHPGGNLAVVSWKIAESETSDYARQLLVHALAAARCGRWPGVVPEAIEPYEVNLRPKHPAHRGSCPDAPVRGSGALAALSTGSVPAALAAGARRLALLQRGLVRHPEQAVLSACRTRRRCRRPAQHRLHRDLSCSPRLAWSAIHRIIS